MYGVVGIGDDDAHPLRLCRSVGYRIPCEGTRTAVREPRPATWRPSILLRYCVKEKIHMEAAGDHLYELKCLVFNDISVLIVDSDVVDPGKWYSWRYSWRWG